MQTPWGEISVNDAHVHFLSHDFFSMLAKQKEELSVDAIGSALGWEMPPVDASVLASRWASELDKHDVAQCALIASLPGDESSVAAAVEAHPDRFWGYFMLNPCADDAIARAEKALDDGLRGICLFPAMHRFSLHDERVARVLDLARTRTGVVVFVHCGVLTLGLRNKLGLPSPFDMRFSNPIDLHAIALGYPGLQFVIPHFGAGYFREALMVSDLCPNVHLDTSSTNSWMKYQSPQLDLKAVFSQAIDVVGTKRLIFGTDSSYFPRGWNRSILDAQIEALSAIGASSDDARAILGGNLERLLT